MAAVHNIFKEFGLETLCPVQVKQFESSAGSYYGKWIVTSVWVQSILFFYVSYKLHPHFLLKILGFSLITNCNEPRQTVFHLNL